MKNILFIIIAILIFSCTKSQANKENIKNDNIEQKTESMNPKYISYEVVKSMPYEEITKQYSPLYTDDFLLSNGESEFRITLYKSIPKEKWNSNIKIKEVTWETNVKENLTVWYQEKNNKWEIISYFVWDKEWEF